MTFPRLLPFLILSLCVSVSAAEPAGTNENFEVKIRPLLVEKCHECHGLKKQEGGLKLTHRDNILAGGDSGPAVVSGKPEESLLIQAIGYQGDLKMPPDGKLSDEQIEVLTRWVKNGAAWPSEDADAIVNSKEAVTRRDLWSLQPVRDVQPPEVHDRQWPATAIDRFLLASMERNGLFPSKPADKRTLIRRITLDLTGLPPSPDEVSRFLMDSSPTAYADVVERLLASPLYGERWGRHWLDVVRYADARDLIQLPVGSDFREAWRYRDWVVKSFNNDLPYDQFVKQQIAGDLLQPPDDSQIDADGLVATGMLALADFVPGDVDKEQMIADYVNDQIDVVGRAFLGLTIACARCHDHKFDPISTEDYYALAGIFFSSRLIPGPVAGNTPLVRVPLLPAQTIRAIEAETERDKKRIAYLAPRVQAATDRAFFAELEQQVDASIARELPAAIEYYHRSRAPNPPELEAFAKESAINVAVLKKWQEFLQQGRNSQVLAPLLAEQQQDNLRGATENLAKEFASISSRRRESIANDPISQALADSEIARLRADDPFIEADENQHVKRWPSRTAIAEDAASTGKPPGPKLEAADIEGTPRRVLHYDGNAALRLPLGMPVAGTLVAYFRPAPNAQGTRLVGWEDAAVGQHGVGLMMREGGGLHAIVRRNGASGDVVAENGNLDWQLVTLTWGAGGTTLCRDGKPVGSNAAIDSASADPAITALQIGGPGSSEGLRFVGDLAEMRIYSQALDNPARQRVEDEIRSHWTQSGRDVGSPELAPTSPREGVQELFAELLSSRGPYWVPADKRWESLLPPVREQLSAERVELEQLKNKPAVEIPQAVSVQDGGPPGTRHEGFRDSHVFIRGNPKKLGKAVPRGVPAAFGNSISIQQGSGRSELAQWITRADHPLTARVIVNRVWQHHFGEGLVRTSTNFGTRGERPSHPELLDYLASRFVESGWSIKELHRTIVLSRAYQQSSSSVTTADPENRFFSRMPRRRLDAEEIRDSLLTTSGLLMGQTGGPGFLEIAVPRRTLYLMSVRTGAKAADFAPLFDGSTGGGIIERRNQSTVAPQALFFMNDAWLDQVAAALVDRVTRESPDEAKEERIQRLYEILFARPPMNREIDIGLQLMDDSSAVDPWARYCRVLLCSNEFIHVD
jgi:hypothetical protein